MVDDDAIAWPGHHAQYQRKAADGTINDHHFVCPRWQPARGIARGNGFPQRGQPELVIARQRKVLGNRRQRMGIRLMDFGPGIECGGGQVQRRAGRGKRRYRAGIRQDHA